MLTDSSKYPKWNPLFTKLTSRPTKEGKTMEVYLENDKWNMVVTELHFNKLLRLQAIKYGKNFLTFEWKTTIEELTDTRLQVTSNIKFHGLFLPIFWSSIESRFLPGLNKMSNALKSGAEKLDLS